MEFECWWELRLTLLLIILVRTFRDDVGEISMFNTGEWDSFFVITDHLQPCLTVSPSHQATGLDWTGQGAGWRLTGLGREQDSCWFRGITTLLSLLTPQHFTVLTSIILQ